MRFILLIFLSFFTFSNTSSSQYLLVVEQSNSKVSKEHKVFKIYIELQDKTDRVSAVFGTDLYPISINVPEGVFNSEFNASWSASGINPRFFELAPELEDDSYATIGLTGPASLSSSESEDPTMVEDKLQPWSVFFKHNGAKSLVISTRTGGSWFILKTAINGVAGKKKKVLLASITTAGIIYGNINVQIFPMGEGANSEKITFEFNGVGTTQGVPFSK